MKSKTRNIGQNRGRPRIWLEGQELIEAGFHHGQRWMPEAKDNLLILKADPNGKRKIAGTKDRPIIDMVGRIIEQAFNVNEVQAVTVKKVRDGLIHLTPFEGE